MNASVLASSNQGKIREIQAILQNQQILPQSAFNIAPPAETGSTFVENAIIKARHAAQYAQLPAIADDSGLVVDALDGAPGVISAYYAGASATDRDNVDKLLQNMQAIADDQRTARFICVMVYMRHHTDPMPIIAQGIWEGSILHKALGDNGFGYDPIFWNKEYQCSAAQLSATLKNQISHRSKALSALKLKLASLCIPISPQ